MKKLITLWLTLASTLVMAQNPQSQSAPIFAANAKYVNGVAPGYWPTAGTGLVLNLSSGTVNCSGTIITYTGGTLTMSASTTNYVYLNTSAACVPAVKTSSFTSTDIPLAIVVSGSSTITSINDTRTQFSVSGSGGGSPAGNISNIQIKSSSGTFGAVAGDYDLLQGQNGDLENGGILSALNGQICHGDSNSGGTGVPTGDGWCAQQAYMLNTTNNATATGYFGTTTYQLAGDNVQDFANWALLGDNTQDTRNPFYSSSYGTNNFRFEGSTTPSTAHQISFKAAYAAGIAWDASSNATDKYLPASSAPVSATSYQIVENTALTGTTIIVQAANAFIPYQQVVLSGWTTSPMTTLNNTVASISPTGLSPTEYELNVTTLAVTGSTSDTGIAAVSTPWTFSGTWQTTQPLTAQSFASDIPLSQGAGWQIGNQASLSCGSSPAIYNVVLTANGPTITGFTVNVTAAGGVVTGVTIATGGSGITVFPAYFTLPGFTGTNPAVIEVLTASGGAATSVSLISGGSGGYSSGVYTPSNSGQLTAGSLQLAQFGTGCVPGNATVTCLVGSASSCGYSNFLSLNVGPAMETTSTGGSESTPAISDAQALNVPIGGDVLLIYPSGPYYAGGSLQFLIDGTPALDSYQNSTTISEYISGQFNPANFSSGNTFQLAHFQTTQGKHQFTVQCASGVLCGGFALIIPTVHMGGGNVPNITVAGTIPMENNAQPSCGLTLPQSCTSFYNGMIYSTVSDISGTGLRVKYADTSNIDPYLDFLNNSGTSPYLINNRIPNTTNSLHMDVSGHTKLAADIVWASKATAAPSTSPTLTGLTINAPTNSIVNWPFLGGTTLNANIIQTGLMTYEDTIHGNFDGIVTTANAGNQSTLTLAGGGQMMIAPTGYAPWRACSYTPANGVPITSWSASALNCQWEVFNGNMYDLPTCVASSGTTNCQSGILYMVGSAYNGTTSGKNTFQQYVSYTSPNAVLVRQWTLASATSVQSFDQSPAGGRNYTNWNMPSGVNVTHDFANQTTSHTYQEPPCTATCVGAVGITLPYGTPTYTSLGSGVTSVACASGYTCTNRGGEFTITGGTFTTGTVFTLTFSASLTNSPKTIILSQNGGASSYQIGHGVCTATGCTITAGVTIASATVNVDYELVSAQ